MDYIKSRNSSRPLWRCSQCSFDNIQDYQLCEICLSDKPPISIFSSKLNSIIPQLPQPKIRQTLACLDSRCNTENDIHEIQCIKCGKFLIQGLEDESDTIPRVVGTITKTKRKQKRDQKKIKGITCKQCLNDIKASDINCWYCTSSLNQKSTLQRSKYVRPKYKNLKDQNYCQQCQSYKKEILKGKGYIYQCECLQLDQIIDVEKYFCNFCFISLEPEDHNEHALFCKQRNEFYDRGSQVYQRCSPLQIHNIMYMNDKSEKFHYAFQNKLYKRILDLGYSHKDLENLYFYIVNLAPIIIHMHADKHFAFFLNDTHYRNQFETAKSSGCKDLKVRGGWEDSMFDSLYQKAEPYERVKYGTMNFTNDPHGVSVCTGYGKSYFLLKEHVRNRCTMTDEYQTIICTFRFCYQLLFNFTDKEIHAAFEGAKAQEVKSEGIIAAYKQIQIHGPIEFKKDIERVYIHLEDIARNPKCLDEVKEFCRKNKIEYEEFGRK